MYYGTLAGLIKSGAEATAAGDLSRRMRVLTHPALLVVDEIGYTSRSARTASCSSSGSMALRALPDAWLWAVTMKRVSHFRMLGRHERVANERLRGANLSSKPPPGDSGSSYRGS